MKKLIFGLLAILLITATANSAFASFGGGSGGKPPPCVPEPVSCILFLASGATYAGMRYLRSRKNTNKLDDEISRNL